MASTMQLQSCRGLCLGVGDAKSLCFGNPRRPDKHTGLACSERLLSMRTGYCVHGRDGGTKVQGFVVPASTSMTKFETTRETMKPTH